MVDNLNIPSMRTKSSTISLHRITCEALGKLHGGHSGLSSVSPLPPSQELRQWHSGSPTSSYQPHYFTSNLAQLLHRARHQYAWRPFSKKTFRIAAEKARVLRWDAVRQILGGIGGYKTRGGIMEGYAQAVFGKLRTREKKLVNGMRNTKPRLQRWKQPIPTRTFGQTAMRRLYGSTCIKPRPWMKHLESAGRASPTGLCFGWRIG